MFCLSGLFDKLHFPFAALYLQMETTSLTSFCGAFNLFSLCSSSLSSPLNCEGNTSPSVEPKTIIAMEGKLSELSTS